MTEASFLRDGQGFSCSALAYPFDQHHQRGSAVFLHPHLSAFTQLRTPLAISPSMRKPCIERAYMQIAVDKQSVIIFLHFKDESRFMKGPKVLINL